ncbi:ABC transporter permease [Candidatus Halobonum tyrrellensis]|uniref:Binding-protein-dependent transport systems inner membrane component n=1 Tax=Candidatus Halobonum tyrrellensis G22 TaxID=1324957 RepID=V4HI15_9EURY|nr:ABC transporter permease [Candidatus Halobonum tyrrellensis]ESP89398.1 binding-protein-dependent transport systems inner membrane component [Candidatus Halobonum tyrrellensis G22]
MATERSDDRSTLEAARKRWEPRFERLRSGWSRFTEHRMGVVGLFIFVVYVLWALFPGVFAPHSTQWVAYLGEPPFDARLSAEQIETLPHPPAFGDPFFAPLGTNSDGQGVLTLLIYSAYNAMYIGLAAGLLSTLVGVPLGLISGFYGDTWIDETIQRFVDIMYGLPFLPFLIVLVAIRGMSTTNIIIGIAVTSWLNNCIVIRGETLSLKERSYVESAKVAGASDTRIIFRHIMPNVLPLSFVYLAQDAAGAILAQASLAYLGLADFTSLSWGIMLRNIQNSGYVFQAWWWLIPPGLALMLLAAAFYFIGFSMEDVTNPQQ